MTLKPSTTYAFAWTFNTFAGGATNPDGGVTGQAWLDGDSVVLTVTLTNKGTGVYEYAFTTGAYTNGQGFQIKLAPVHGGITYNELVLDAVIDSTVASDLSARIPAALVGGRMDANAGAISGDATAADNLEAACDGTTYNLGGGAVVSASVTGAVGSVTGAVASVTGNVGGNVVGSTASVTGAVGSVTGAVGFVTGAVGSVTGNVGGNVVGSVASVTGAVGSVTGAVGSVTGSVGSVASFGTLIADIWHHLLISITMASSIGKLIKDYLDATISSRNATAPDNAGITAIKTNTDKVGTAMELDGAVYRYTTNALEQAPTGGGTAPTAEQVAAQVRVELTTELARVDATVSSRLASVSYTTPPTVGQIEDAVLDAVASDHNTALSIGAKINAAGSSADPMANEATDYVHPQLGFLIGRLDVSDGVSPIIAVPAQPEDADICRVYGYIRNTSNRPVDNLSFTAELTPIASDAKTDTGFSLERTKITFYTNKDGRIVDALGNLYVDLIKTSALAPVATAWKYRFVCTALKLDETIVVTTDLLDVSSLIV